MAALSSTFCYLLMDHVLEPYNPAWLKATWFRLFRVRSPLLSESLLISLPSGTEMFHFPEFASKSLCIQQLDD